MKKRKLKYSAPTIHVDILELEQGIAAASISPKSGDGNTNNPTIGDWDEQSTNNELYL